MMELCKTNMKFIFQMQRTAEMFLSRGQHHLRRPVSHHRQVHGDPLLLQGGRGVHAAPGARTAALAP